jgi:hypothetical protein
VEPKLQAVTIVLGGEPTENGILELPKLDVNIRKAFYVEDSFGK